MTGLPVNPSSTMWLSNSALPRARKYPGISHSTSSVRHERILERSVCRNPSMYRSTVRLLSDMTMGLWSRSACVRDRGRLPDPHELPVGYRAEVETDDGDRIGE